MKEKKPVSIQLACNLSFTSKVEGNTFLFVSCARNGDNNHEMN